MTLLKLLGQLLNGLRTRHMLWDMPQKDHYRLDDPIDAARNEATVQASRPVVKQ